MTTATTNNADVGPFRIKHYWHATRLQDESYRAWLRRAAKGKVANPEIRGQVINIKTEATATMARKRMQAVGS